MLKKYFEINGNLVLISLLLAAAAVLAMPYQLYIIAAVIFFTLTAKFGERFLITFVIFSYLTIPSDINDFLRILLNIFNILILSYLFFQKYGIEFKKYPLVPKPLMYLFAFTFFTMILSAIMSASLFTGLIEISRTAVFLIIIYYLYSFLSEDKVAFSYFYAMLISAGIITFSLFYEFFKSDKFIYLLSTMGYVTLGGFFTNSTAVGGFLAITVSITLIYLFIDYKKKHLMLTKIFLLLQVIALLLTNARAAIAAAIISSLFMLFFTRRKLFKRIFFALIIFIPLVFLLQNFNTLIDDYFRTNRILENTRYYLWDMAFGMIGDHPLLGVGPGMFNHYMYTYLPVAMGSWTEQQIYVLQQIAAAPAHNFFLMRASEEGVFGLISAVGIFAIFFSYGFMLIQKTKNLFYNYHILSVGIVGIGLGLFARSFFESTGIFTNGWITRDLPFWLLFAILVYMKEIISESSQSSELPHQDILSEKS